MPELPEVETIVRGLDKKLKNKTIKEVEVLDKKALTLNIGAPKFREQAVGQAVKSISRRGKMIIIKLREKYLLIHLKMTGQLVLASDSEKIAGGHPIAHGGKELPNKFTRVIFKFSDNGKLYFNDVRKFGWVKLVDIKGLEENLKNLGVEPLSKEFTLKKFKEILARKNNAIVKQAIMDQKYIAGIGNLYADEILFTSGIKPFRQVKTLSESEIKNFWQAIPRVLKYAVKHRGTSFSDYVDAKGEVGSFAKYLKVYGRAGEKCKKCGQSIKKMKLGGRSAHWCDICQK